MKDNGQNVSPAEWARLQEENVRTLKVAIVGLEQEFLSQFGFFKELDRAIWPASTDEIDFSTVWSRVKDVQELFKTLRPVHRDSRERLWERLNRFRECARQAQNAQQNRLRCIQSNHYRTVSRALQDIESKYELGNTGSFAFGARPNVRTFNEDAHAAKELLSTLKLSREQRNELWGWFNKLRDKVRSIKEQNHAEWVQRQQQLTFKIAMEIDRANGFIDKLYSFVGQEEGYVERLKAQIAGSEGFLDRQRDHLRELEYKLDGASSSYADRVQGWIREAEDKIEEVKQQIQDKIDRIEEVQGRIAEKHVKIEAVRRQIAEKRERIHDIRAKM